MSKCVSIIVCCYNSAQKLPKTLEYLAKQKVSADISYEVVLVDNASSDNTQEVARSYWDEFSTKAPLRIVYEGTPGLVYARICGVKAAKYELLIFCDDDNWLREDYIQTAVDIMNADPKIGVLGGQSTLVPGIEAPDWWDEQQGNYAVGKQLPTTGLANERGFLYGAGFITRKSLAQQIFSPLYPLLLTGRKGSECLSGEDWEYCQRALMLGYNIYYSEDLFYWHDIAQERLTTEKLEQLLSSFQIGKPIMERYEYVQKFYNNSILKKYLILFKRVVNYLLSTSATKERKIELLKMQLVVCGMGRTIDSTLTHIINWKEHSAL